jgi:hypothetical protein
MDADEIRSGCSGGIGGSGAGVVLSQDGRLWTWKRNRAESDSNRGPLIGTDARAAMQLFESAKLGGFKN